MPQNGVCERRGHRWGKLVGGGGGGANQIGRLRMKERQTQMPETLQLKALHSTIWHERIVSPFSKSDLVEP